MSLHGFRSLPGWVSEGMKKRIIHRQVEIRWTRISDRVTAAPRKLSTAVDQGDRDIWPMSKHGGRIYGILLN